MDKLEIKQQNTSDPSIDRCVRLHVWIVNHTLDILSVHLDSEVPDTEYPYTDCVECAEESVKL